MADFTSDLIQKLAMRPKCYITLEFSTTSPSYATLSGSGTLSVNDFSNFTEIGAVQRLEINSTRDVNVWRELKTSTAGKPVESYPGLTSYELSLERVVLYETNLLGVFGFDEFDIIKQNKPLSLRVKMAGLPGVTTGVTQDKTWIIYGVWFKSNPMAFDVTDISDIRIIQDIDAVAAGVVGPSSTPAA